jgi:hypothetical protein
MYFIWTIKCFEFEFEFEFFFQLYAVATSVTEETHKVPKSNADEREWEVVERSMSTTLVST